MPQIIKPLTDISKGGAQVFDVSGVADLQRHKDAKKNAEIEKLMANSLNYDPTGLYREDVSIYKDMMEEYQTWIGDNNEALLNPGENIEIWQEKQFKENRLKNYVAFSKNKNTQIDAATKMSMSDPKYMRDDNLSNLANVGATSQADFDSGLTSSNYITDLNRNYTDLKDNYQYAAIVEDALGKVIEKTMPGREVDKDGIRGMMMGTTTSVDLPRDMVKEALTDLFNTNKPEGRDLTHKYRNEEDPIGAFVDDVMLWTRSDKGYAEGLTKASGTSGGTISQNELDARTMVSLQPKSGYKTLETVYNTDRTTQEVDIVNSKGKTKKGDVEGYYPKTYVNKNGITKNTEILETVGHIGESVLYFNDRQDVVVEGSIGGSAFNLATGEKVKFDEIQNIQSTSVSEVGDYRVTTKDDVWLTMSVPTGEKDKNGMPVKISSRRKYEKGNPLPDMDELLDDGIITQAEYDRIVKTESIPFRGAIVYASSEPLKYWQSSGSAARKAGASPQPWLIPYNEIQGRANSAMRQSTASKENPEGRDIESYNVFTSAEESGWDFTGRMNKK